MWEVRQRVGAVRQVWVRGRVRRASERGGRWMGGMGFVSGNPGVSVVCHHTPLPFPAVSCSALPGGRCRGTPATAANVEALVLPAAARVVARRVCVQRVTGGGPIGGAVCHTHTAPLPCHPAHLSQHTPLLPSCLPSSLVRCSCPLPTLQSALPACLLLPHAAGHFITTSPFSTCKFKILKLINFNLCVVSC